MIIGILGGTFDPPHNGHLVAAKRVIEAALTDEVWFVPCLAHRFGKAPASFAHRLAMCRLLIENTPHMRVSDIEGALNRPGYTFDLVTRLGADYPQHAFRLIAGTDIYHQREAWHRYDEIAALAPPIYVEREGENPIPEPTLPAPPNISSHEIRAEIQRGVSPKDTLPDSVRRYISTHNLYRN